MNLFLIVPNNSGSTLLHNLIATSKSVATLPIEGQFCNFAGPDTENAGLIGIFSLKESLFRNEKNYNWFAIESAWNKLWRQDNPNAIIYLEKSPPNVLRIEMLERHFYNSKFILMIRNPYAMIEGILRNNRQSTLDMAIRHTDIMFSAQMNNIAKYKSSLFLKYEDLTENPVYYSNLIMDYIGVQDINYAKIFKCKTYISEIRNFNDDQIARLSKNQINNISNCFRKHENMMNLLGYDIL